LASTHSHFIYEYKGRQLQIQSIIIPKVMPLFALGSNGCSQLGFQSDDVSSPSRVDISLEAPTIIASIKAGGNHTLILTESGIVFSAGQNTDGQCAQTLLSPQSDSFVSVNDRLPSKINLIAATWEASIFATESNLHVCGSGTKGELGLGQGIVKSDQPRQIPDFPPQGTHIIDLAACMSHVVAVLSNGDVYGWGNGQHGQLGDSLGIFWQPRKIESIPFRVSRAVCGKDFTCVFGDPIDGRLRLLGMARRDKYNIKSNTPRTIEKWVDVQASWGGVYVLLSDNTLLAWGRNDHGQLPPTGLSVAAMAAGSEHMLVLTTSGKVLARGWGEHGNCGSPIDEQSDVKGRWNELVVNGHVRHVGAGCATSWIATS
jgi:protein ATS1